jgi:glycosyltransferase involved in cell wall biosynthesis
VATKKVNILMKKIAIVLSAQHAIPHGGIGQFAKAITELLQSYGHEVHLIFDKKPKNKFLLDVGDRTPFYNIKPLRTEPSEDRHAQGIDPAKIENFRSILESLKDFDYDLYLVNTSEAFASISQVKTNAKVILYTHLFNQIYPAQAGKSVFTPEYVQYFNSFLYQSHTVATQSEHNRKQLISHGVKDCIVMPMPLPEQKLLLSSQGVEKSGVLYIGTHSPGKNPGAYIKAMAKTGLPCKVMTSAKGKIKFEENFKKAGITNYDIRVGITGQEKVDFITSSKVFFMPSLLENYPFAFLECVGHMPVVVLDTQTWSDNFDSKFYHKVNTRKAHEKILELYNKPYNDDALEYVKELNNLAKTAWSKL